MYGTDKASLLHIMSQACNEGRPASSVLLSEEGRRGDRKIEDLRHVHGYRLDVKIFRCTLTIPYIHVIETRDATLLP